MIFQLQNPKDAIKQCNEALKIDENDVDALCDRAEAHILNEMYDEGEITDLKFHFSFSSILLFCIFPFNEKKVAKCGASLSKKKTHLASSSFRFVVC